MIYRVFGTDGNVLFNFEVMGSFAVSPVLVGDIIEKDGKRFVITERVWPGDCGPRHDVPNLIVREET